MSGTSFYPTPNRISNRGFIMRMKQWGWREKQTKNGITTMMSPHGYEVNVHAPNNHKRNADTTYRAVTEAMGISWETFVSYNMDDELLEAMSAFATMEPAEVERFVDTYILKLQIEEAGKKFIKSAIDAERQRQIKADRKSERKAANAHTQEPLFVEPRPVAAPSNIPVKESVVLPDDTVRVETEDGNFEVIGVSKNEPETWETARHVDRVLSYLMEAGGAVPVAKMADDMHRSRAQISSACASLMRYGLVTRVKSGVYAIDPASMKRDLGVDVMHRHEEAALAGALAVPDQKPAPAPSSPAPAPEDPAARVPAAPVPDEVLSYDQIANEVLDLMFPDGFKAKHLPVIDLWRNATVELLREVRG